MLKNIYWFILKISRSNPITRVIIDYLALWYYKLFRSDKVFTFNHKTYPYFYHIYNRTVAGERVVEIPIALKYIQDYKDKNILEVGNVLSHYFHTSHTILDKYEKAPGVKNLDVLTFKLKQKFDLIISISTLEHVGFNYGEKLEPAKLLPSLKNLISHLTPQGKLVVTLPVHFNPNVFNLINKRKMPFTQEYFLIRTSYLNDWIQVSRQQAISAAGYDGHFSSSNALYVGVYQKASVKK